MKKILLALVALFAFTLSVEAQKKGKDKDTDEKPKSVWDDGNFSGLKFRSVGPAFMAGRIADIAIHPEDDNVWYVAVGSGGVWKTKNAGVTWSPIFDGQSVYSTGCITIDPNNSHRVWLGTGENVGGRHASWGDGIYLSENDGKSWKNMGLKKSEHISKIIVHPENSNVIWVASQGPMWSKGGERGIYKSSDGGKTWNNVLSKGLWTGATDLLIDPRNPDVLYAALWQHHRTVAAWMGGGPETGIYRSVDGGENWEELKSGLPSGNMGKIGMAISPQQPDVIYAAVEEELKKGGVYRSSNRGSSWKKMSDMVAGGTGPHYYQELYACPHNFDRIYFANNYFKVSNDGGKTFKNVPNKWKHVDNHALAFRTDDPDYLLVGTDGGLYESFDLSDNWRHMSNMPITQYYKLALDDAEPFYNIYGGTQDNNTQGGPSRTDNRTGIQNGDWKVILGGDGHQPATEPGNPNIVYGQSQEGYYSRVDLVTGESIGIQPQAGEGEDYERYNWDAPILVSPHSPSQIYVASQRLWRSDNRGDKWTALSGDLTRNEERFELPIMGKKQSYNMPWDVYAMSNYNTITSISESPVQRDLIYVGTDDGLIQITENGGQSWTKVEVSSLPGVPKRAYVNDIKADLHDANTVYIALDNHKNGDYKPYIFKSSNKGKTWTSISSNLPKTNLVWRIAQDYKKKDLIFIGTEFGAYFTPNGGNKWVKLKGGMPTISVRDLAIQKREDDLVLATFGRSFYVYDDIAAFREFGDESLNSDAKLFSMRDADWFLPRMDRGWSQKGSMGADFYTADNPEYGAVFTYYLKEGYKTKKSIRKKKEKELKEQDIPFPGWDALEEERREEKPSIWLTIKDNSGKTIRKMEVSAGKGFHRVAWDLRKVSNRPLRQGDSGKEKRPGGELVNPGKYSVTLSRVHNGESTVLDGPMEFNVVRLRNGALQGPSEQEKMAFYERFSTVQNNLSKFRIEFSALKKDAKTLKEAIVRSNAEAGSLSSELKELMVKIEGLNIRLNGQESRSVPGEKSNPTIRTRLSSAGRTMWGSTYGPTQTALDDVTIAEKELKGIESDFQNIENLYNSIKTKAESYNLPWYEGRN